MGNVLPHGLRTPEVHGRSIDRRLPSRGNELSINRKIEVRLELKFVIENQPIAFSGKIKVCVIRKVDGRLRICSHHVLQAQGS